MAVRSIGAPQSRARLTDIALAVGRRGRSLRFAAVAGTLIAAPSTGGSTPPKRLHAKASSEAARQATTVNLVIAATTDTHGRLRGWEYYANKADAPNGHITPVRAVGIAYAAQHRRPITNTVATSAPIASTPVTQRARTLRIITTSDFHAALESRKDEKGIMRGGAVALEAAIQTARDECKTTCTSINIDGGDLFSGTPASDWDSGKPTVDVYNRMGISAGALGNHEFDFGQDTLKMRLSQLKYRVLAANVLGDDGNIPSWLKADTVVERNGLRIGVIGAAARSTPSLTKLRNVRGLKFLAAAPVVSERIKALRALNVDAVIVTMHDGGRCTSGVSESCTGSGMDVVKALTEKPDAVILAHAHTNVRLVINGIPCVQVTSSGRAIGIIDIPLSPNGEVVTAIRDVIDDNAASIDIVTDTIVKNAVARVQSRLERPVATIAETMLRRGEQYPLGNIIADAMRVMSNSDFGAWNNGGVRADLLAGAANFGAVHEISPFGNTVVRVSMRGKDVQTLLEGFVAGRTPNAHISGLVMTYDSSRAPGQRVVSVLLPHGKPLDPTHIYTIGVNDFMSDDPTIMRPALIVNAEVLTVHDEDALAEYLRRLPQPVQPPKDVRIKNIASVKNEK